MKKQILSLSLITLFTAITIVSCKKNDSKEENFNTEASVQTDDQSQFSAQLDAVANDANIALESTGTMALRGEGDPAPPPPLYCNATVTADSSNATRTITIVYNGADCAGYFSRTGTVTISIPAGVHWKNAGAAITVNYQNLVVTRVLDNKSITISGSHTITNVSGGLMINFPAVQSITHSITSNGMTIKFGDNTQRTWQVAKQRVFTYNNGLVITTTGTHSDGTSNNIAEWGTNRFGNTFTSAITAPLVVRQDCSFRLVSGQVKHSVPLFTATATFGLDAQGNPTTCPGQGHYYVKIMWTGLMGIPHTVILPY